MLFGPDGKLLASAGGHETLMLWHPEKLETLGKPLKVRVYKFESLKELFKALTGEKVGDQMEKLTALYLHLMEIINFPAKVKEHGRG